MASSETKIDGVVILQMSTTGSSYLTPALFYSGMSGSLQRLVTGETYLVAGANVTITTQSNGQVVIAASATGGSGGGSLSSTSGAYGDGSDGAAVLDGSNTYSWATKSGNAYFQNRDVKLSSLTVNANVTFFPHGCRTFVSGDCIISGNMNNDAGNGSTISSNPGPGGVGGMVGTFFGGGKGGGNDGGPEGTSYGVLGVNAYGGNAYNNNPGASYTSVWPLLPMGTWTPDAVMGIIFSKVGTSCSLGGGAGGAAGAQGSGGGGGGVIALITKTLTVVTGGMITAFGGNNDPNGHGGGGGGGLIVIVTSGSIVNNGLISAANGHGASNGGPGKVLTYTVQ